MTAPPSSRREASAAESPLARLGRLLTSAHPAVTDAAERRAAQFLSALIVVAIPVGVGATLSRAAADPDFAAQTGAPIAAILGLLVPYAVARSRHVRLAAWFITCGALAVATVIAVVTVEPWPLVGYLGVPVLIGGIVLPQRQVFVVIALVYAVIAALCWTAPPFRAIQWVTVALSYVAFVSGIVIVGGVLRSLIEEERAAALTERERRYRAAFEAAFAGWIVVEDATIVETSARFSELFRSSEVATGRAVTDLVDPPDRARFDTLVASGTAGEFTLARPTEPIELEVVAAPLLTRGATARIVAFRHVSAAKRTQRMVDAAERAISLGEVAASVAHEIANPLAYVSANLQALEQDFSRDPRAALAEMREGVERIRVVASDLQTLARPSTDTAGVVRVASVVELALRMTALEMRQVVPGVVREFRADPRVRGDAQRLGQLFVNLLTNAARSLDATRKETNAVRVTIEADLVSGAWIEVADTGVGVPPELLPRLFEPYISSRRGSGGTGLGLAICHDVAHAHGGRIEVTSRPGDTRFRVFLPTIDGDSPSSAPEPTPAPPNLGPLRVLVIDDEPAIARAIRRLLREHEVTIATSGSEGVAVATGAHFDAIICDLMMPDLSGVDVYDALVAVRPQLARRFMLLTGGAFTPDGMASLARFVGPVLTKPADAATLRRALAELTS